VARCRPIEDVAAGAPGEGLPLARADHERIPPSHHRRVLLRSLRRHRPTVRWRRQSHPGTRHAPLPSPPRSARTAAMADRRPTGHHQDRAVSPGSWPVSVSAPTCRTARGHAAHLLGPTMAVPRTPGRRRAEPRGDGRSDAAGIGRTWSTRPRVGPSRPGKDRPRGRSTRPRWATAPRGVVRGSSPGVRGWRTTIVRRLGS